MSTLKRTKAYITNNISLRSKWRIFLSISLLGFILILTFLISGYYSAFKTISYLPSNIAIDSIPSNIGGLEMTNPWFKLIVDKKGRVSVMNLKSEVIMSSLTYFADYAEEKPTWGYDNLGIKKVNDSTILISGTSIRNVHIDIFLNVHQHLPTLDVNIKTHYSTNTLVNREALVAAFDVPVSEVYLKNRKMDTGNFEQEYWLNKEGARFGSNERTALVYHPSNISSLQLATEKKVLFINLEYYLDHPHTEMPFDNNGNGKLVDFSRARFTKGSVRSNNFSINFGLQPRATPRLMSVPEGFQACYVFTEHADGGNIRTQRAAYFGSENIMNAKDAIGGFVGNKIPVTKSIFYKDPTGERGSAIWDKQKDSSLMLFLDQLHSTGLYDICLHTPENENSNRKVLSESIHFMKDRYNSISWIDHGFFSGKINREAFVADGLDSNSIYYAADLWEKYDTRYFWSPAVEFLHEASHVSIFNQIMKIKFYEGYVNFWKHHLSPRQLKELSPPEAIKKLVIRYLDKYETNSLSPNMGDSYPTPLYWQHTTHTNQFYSWATNFVQLYINLSPKVVEREKVQLDNLVRNWGVFISHGYYVRKTTSNLLITDQNNSMVINPDYENILESIAQKRDKGELYTTTVRDLLNYWIKLDNVLFEYLPNGEIDIINKNNEPIKGLSLAFRTDHIKIEGKTLSNKKVGDDSIFWFDMNANETVRLKFLN